MALDEAVVNLQRFIGLVIASTAALETSTEFFKEGSQKFADLENETSQEGDGLNDELEEIAAALDTGKGDAEEALTALVQAATTGQGTAAEAQAKVGEAAGDVEEKARTILTHVDEAHARLTEEGFEALGQTLDGLQQELDTEAHETEQAFTELGSAMAGFESDAHSAWEVAETEVEKAVSDIGVGESAIEAASSEGVEGFTSASTEFEQKCSDLEQAVDLVYDVLETAVAEEGQTWQQEAERMAGEAVAFVEGGARERVEQPAGLVQDEALASLGQEYAAVGTVIDAGATTAGELEPLTEELVKCVTVVGQIDDLMNALAG